MTTRTALLLAGLLGFTAVAIGAFGAHGLADRLDEYSLGVLQTGNRYHTYHALALLGLAVHLPRLGRAGAISAWSFTLGTLIFAGTLYALALTGHKWLGAITPLGGIFLMVGWISLGIGALRLRTPA